MAEERVKPRSMYVEEAVQLALESRWAEALAVNQALVERHGPDEDTHNRIGKALTEAGRLDDALAAYSATLQINPLNIIAQKNVRKLSHMLENKGVISGTGGAIDVDLFTEEPGKSALTVLAAPSRAVSGAVSPGDIVELYRSDSTLRAQTARGVTLGDVEPKVARRLVPLMEAGNRYSAAVARVEDQAIEIIIREVFQAPENARKSSFPLAKSARRDEFRPYAKESLLSAREIDAEPLRAEDGDALGGDGDEPDEEFGALGMSTFQGGADETPPEQDSEEEDDDARPEDSY